MSKSFLDVKPKDVIVYKRGKLGLPSDASCGREEYDEIPVLVTEVAIDPTTGKKYCFCEGVTPAADMYMKTRACGDMIVTEDNFVGFYENKAFYLPVTYMMTGYVKVYGSDIANAMLNLSASLELERLAKASPEDEELEKALSYNTIYGGTGLGPSEESVLEDIVDTHVVPNTMSLPTGSEVHLPENIDIISAINYKYMRETKFTLRLIPRAYENGTVVPIKLLELKFELHDGTIYKIDTPAEIRYEKMFGCWFCYMDAPMINGTFIKEMDDFPFKKEDVKTIFIKTDIPSDFYDVSYWEKNTAVFGTNARSKVVML